MLMGLCCCGYGSKGCLGDGLLAIGLEGKFERILRLSEHHWRIDYLLQHVEST